MAVVGRLLPLDLARSAALLGMVIFHFNFDLEMFGYTPQGTMFAWGWQIFARLVAGSFLFLAGFSLFLAHGDHIRWPKLWRRLLLLGGAAAMVTVATYIGMPDQFIYFGILHSITAATLIGLAALRLPAWLVLLAGGAVLVVANTVELEIFNPIWLQWTGLGTNWRQSLDFEPLFPWLAPFLFGLGTAKLAIRWGLLDRRPQAVTPANKVLETLAWPGKHSLAIYLAHQPILIGLMWAATQFIR